MGFLRRAEERAILLMALGNAVPPRYLDKSHEMITRPR